MATAVKTKKEEKTFGIPQRKDEAHFIKSQSKRWGVNTIMEGTLLYVDPTAPQKTIHGHKVSPEVYTKYPRKQVILVKCLNRQRKPTDETRWVATSDLHHESSLYSEETAREIKLEKMKERRKQYVAKKKKASKG